MFRKTFYLTVIIAAISPAALLGQQPNEVPSQVVVQHDVVMKTRDGVSLRADIYSPAGNQRLPVLLQRTPYNKIKVSDFAHKAVLRGYLVVAQDVRGRYASEGEWYPFKHEIEDGYDAVEWAAALPNSNGKVGMWGGSYVGATQMLAAIAHPPHLAGICPWVTASNYHENWTYQGGAFEQWFNESWTTELAQNTFDRVIEQGTNAVTGSTTLPLKQYPLFNVNIPDSSSGWTKQLAPYFLDWLDHPRYDSYWKQWAIDENYASIQVPSLTMTAWYDIFQDGSLRNYAGLKAHAGNQTARAEQRLLIAIGGHSGGGRKIGSVDFGPAAEEFDPDKVTLDWYDYLFQGKRNQFTSSTPVRIFVMGENKWRDEKAWPLERARPTRYFLDSSGKASSVSGDGALVTNAPSKKSDDRYVYDPLHPVPTVGGPLCCDTGHLAPGPRDQQPVEARPDVLVYSTPALEQDTEVTGPVTVNLYASTSAADTDFTAKLVDVAPDGFAKNLTEGILRAKYRESTSEAKLVAPGAIYEYKIDLWSTSNVFLKGHKIRLEVSSSNFPRFDRNLNTGKDPGADDNTERTAVMVTNIIYHDADHPSALELPIVPR
jgi:putative CocE/NonD family hydrolase